MNDHAMDMKAYEDETNKLNTLMADLFEELLKLPQGREQALAITKADECVMWFSRAIAVKLQREKVEKSESPIIMS